MKKLLALLLVAILALSLSLFAFADTITSLDVPATETGNVNVTVTDSRRPDEITPTYNVVVEWGTLNFTYNITGNWDPENHKYVGNWNNTSGTITVTNHSDAGVDVSAAFPEAQTEVTTNSVTATLGNNTFNLATAVGTAKDAAPSNTITVTITGAPDVTESYTLSTITVTISKAD